MDLIPSQSFFINHDNHKRSNAINKYAFSLKEIDVEKFKKSIRLTLERHQSLREVFVRINGEYKMFIVDTKQVEEDAIKEEERDFTNQSDQQIKQQLMEYGDKITEELHDFEGKVLSRFVIIRDKTSKRRYLLIVLHHLVYDGYSYGLMLADMEKIYASLVKNNQIPELPQAGISIQEYTEYTRNILEKYKFDPSINGSFAYFENLKKRNVIPFYFPPCGGTQKPGYTKYFVATVPSSLMKQLETVSAKYNSKPHIVALYFYVKLAMDRSKQREGTVHFVTNNRKPFEELKKPINLFHSYIAAAKNIDFHFPTDSLQENLNEIKNKFRTSFKSLSFDYLTLDNQNYNKIAKQFSEYPFIYFNYIDYPKQQDSPFILEQLVKHQEVGYYKALHQNPHNFIKFFLMHDNVKGVWDFCYVYNETHFSEKAIKEISDEYIKMLREFVNVSNL